MAKIRDEVITLLNRVPSPPEDILSCGASEAVMSDAEKRIGILFPPKLREWFLTSNGACVGPGGLVGIDTTRDIQNLDLIFENYPIWKKKGWIPVAGDGCGSYYIVATRNEFSRGEPVLFVDVHETSDEPTFIAASNVWTFLRFLLTKEVGEAGWPYSEAEVTNADPEILSFTNVSLPWDA